MKVTTIAKVLLATLLAAALAVTASAGFTKKNTYNGSFSDVKADAWYAKEVASAYELGFVEGVSDTAFSPDTTVTVAQGITMASRVHAEYNGKTITGSGENWYDVYVKYAKDNGIITENQFDSYTRELKRSEMAELFYDAMPDGYFKKINNVKYIPDVPLGAMYWDKLITLYNAGIVMGSDDYGSFKPDSSIVRSECAAIINRVAIPENRKTGELADVLTRDAYTLVYNTSMAGGYEGINSGWVFDNRGGTARVNNSGFNTLGDVSEEYATAYIREFNYIPNGRLVLEFILTTKDNGAFIEYRDIEEKSAYMLKIVDGKWSLLNKDGSFKSFVEAEAKSQFRITVDLDTGKSETFINGVNYGEGALLSDNILSFRAGIDEKGTGSLSFTTFNIVANYGMYENFDIYGVEEVYGWKKNETGINVSNGELYVINSAISKQFDEVKGIVTTQAYFNSRDGKDFSMNIGDILTLESKGGKLTASGKELYTLTKNMWYRLRVDADTNTGKAKVWINGRVAGEVELAKKAGVSSLGVTTTGVAVFDNLMVYETLVHDDYVPAPEHKASFDDYTAVMNVCSIWRNGTHSGWACVSPYDEPKPVIGYYEEGVPETADWEIKYMVEHGIDVQAFCWFNSTTTGPLKTPSYSAQLHEGYMYAKYSGDMKYLINFETESSTGFDSTQFRNYVVPYWFENYFLDDRYYTIDNKLVIAIYGGGALADSKYFGSNSAAKAELDYLRNKAKEYGFDGAIILTSANYPTAIHNTLGFDGSYTYTWFEDGKSLDKNKGYITQAGNSSKEVHGIPTMGVGFDSIPWHGLRNGLITDEDFKTLTNWVANEYNDASTPEWGKNLVWFDTWNEFGEGHYIFPAGQNGNGFGYVDAIRDAFTDFEKEHTDVVPTISQMSRITHMYPQYARLLRREGWYLYNEGMNAGKNAPKSKLYVNDQDILSLTNDATSIPAVEIDGKVYFPFNPSSAVNFILNCHYEWRKDAGTLKIMANGHEVKLEVGSDMYYKDGKLEKLGYTLTTFDGLPMLDFVKLAKDLALRVEEKDGNVYIFTENYESQFKALNDRKTGAWEFNLFDTEGWISSNFNFTVGGGTMLLESIGTSNDPQVYLTGNSFPQDFYAKKFTDVEVKVRYKYNAGHANAIQLFYITDIDGSWTESKCVRLQMTSDDSNGEWQIIKASFAEQTGWQNAERIVGLRIDPFNAQGTMEFDYIRFVEDPDFVYVEPEYKEFAIENGDAEDPDTIKFYSSLANISIVEDPENKKNHVYYVKATGEGETFPYLRHKAEFEPGATYKIDFDIKFAGNNANNPSFNSGTFFCNVRYQDKTAQGSFDHVIHPGAGTSTSSTFTDTSGWIHYTAIHEVKNIDSNNGAEFTVYTVPKNGVAFNYYIDNVSVVKLSEKEALRYNPAANFDWETTEGIHFDFEKDAEGVKFENATVEVVDGNAKMTATNGDVQAIIPGISIDSQEYTAVAIRFKTEGFDAKSQTIQVFFTTDSDGTLDEKKMVRLNPSQYIDDGDGYYTVVIDAAANPLWTGKITTVRFDPANMMGTYYIDDLMIIKTA